ncbi:aminopeptidase N [Shewanella acanthi]|uniref:aminopeptidase N n=1 Tax=Shewanella acanthi TaxID=2864212 RepID=UPI001C659C16|nr:aminopeptidase N [Shewanella acanthi]QYJ80254.1 aminopeptidase N [Shewanella acanthi]
MTQAQAKYLKDYQAPLFTIETIDLNFNLAPNHTQVKAKSFVKRTSEHNEPLVLDGEGLKLVSVTVNGQSVVYQVKEGQLLIETVLNEFELVIETELDPAANSSLEGLYMSDGAYCTQCEAEGFRRITYFLDRPDVLAKYTVRIEAEKSAFPYLLSNGNLVEQGELEGGRHYVCWQDPFPKPAYLFALVAGDFDLLQDEFITRSERKVVLQVYVDKGNLHKAEHAMASLKKSMAWDESRFDLEYDLDIYMIVAVDFFNMGAMENKGLNIFNTKYVLADKLTATDDDYHGIESVVGHEYFHNWTGNRVTCRDWFQLSLKEGLTVFRDQEFSSDLGSRAVNRIHAIKVMKNQQFAEDSGPMSHPIRPDSVIEMNNFYTVTVYDKGAEVIRMMHTLLGEANFQAGMKLYFKRHDGQAVTCDDFVAAMEDASGIDLTQFRLWYSKAGTPVVSVTDSFDAMKGTYQLNLVQSLAGCNEALHIPFSIELLDANGHSKVNQVLNFTKKEQTFTFEGFSQKPICSLLQDFSAPVKLEYPFEVDQLVHLMRYATSEVARWEASVALVSQAIWQNVSHVKLHQTMTLDERVKDGFKGVLLSTELDRALMAEILATPSSSALVEQTDAVDLDALRVAREFVLSELALYCQDELTAVYGTLAHIDCAKSRALKNQCLIWLSRVSVDAEALVVSQFEQAENMTDALGALTAANIGDLPCRTALMSAFEQRWQNTPLVMDKWFMLQATRDSEDVIEGIKQLMQHPSFSMNNPNRVRSLIGSFAAGNLYQFHRNDGEGYRFLTECLIELNKLNPQVAARMVTPLIQFSKFDVKRQALIKEYLGQLLALPELSKDLYEKVSKALGQ